MIRASWYCTTWTTAGVRYLGVTQAVLITVQVDRVQDDLSGLLRLARLWDGIGAQNFVSAFIADRVVKCFAISCVWWCIFWYLCIHKTDKKRKKTPHQVRLEAYYITVLVVVESRIYLEQGHERKTKTMIDILRGYFNQGGSSWYRSRTSEDID